MGKNIKWEETLCVRCKVDIRPEYTLCYECREERENSLNKWHN